MQSYHKNVPSSRVIYRLNDAMDIISHRLLKEQGFYCKRINEEECPMIISPIKIQIPVRMLKAISFGPFIYAIEAKKQVLSLETFRVWDIFLANILLLCIKGCSPNCKNAN
ncbi:unnamed protein product [Lactuca virosa]|uniref:Uncharacterized protein n=1 Tax=Lactuca virosa TaxID=75947 RepID=A0AAU9PLR8_9ASTR|nr:unnamed protein product [Lactuca virosa]